MKFLSILDHFKGHICGIHIQVTMSCFSIATNLLHRAISALLLVQNIHLSLPGLAHRILKTYKSPQQLHSRNHRRKRYPICHDDELRFFPRKAYFHLPNVSRTAPKIIFNHISISFFFESSKITLTEKFHLIPDLINHQNITYYSKKYI